MQLKMTNSSKHYSWCSWGDNLNNIIELRPTEHLKLGADETHFNNENNLHNNAELNSKTKYIIMTNNNRNTLPYFNIIIGTCQHLNDLIDLSYCQNPFKSGFWLSVLKTTSEKSKSHIYLWQPKTHTRVRTVPGQPSLMSSSSETINHYMGTKRNWWVPHLYIIYCINTQSNDNCSCWSSNSKWYSHH